MADLTENQSGARVSASITIEGLAHEFVDPYTGDVVRAVDDLSCHVASGEFVTVVGPSGCGKSTLLNIVAGLLKPTRGVVRVGDRVVTRPGPDRGMVFQELAILPWRTVAANLSHGLEIRGVNKREREAIVRHFIRLVGLEGFEHRYPHELSGGMRQRVAVARTLAADPEVMLMDEPFAAVDAQTRMTLQEELIGIAGRTGKTILFVTHSVDEAVFLGDRVLVLTRRPGRVKESVPVQLARSERTWATISHLPEFIAKRDHVLASVRQEAARDEASR